VQNTILAAFLTFCERVLYPTYATAPRFTAMTALDDQAAAGAIMWVLGSIAFLIPAGCVTIQVLQGPRVAVRPVSGAVGASTASVRGQVSAASPRPFVLAYWRSLPLPPIITTLFAVHQWVKQRAAK
jgi:cytochrome c oxidase assembly factor CtaG